MPTASVARVSEAARREGEEPWTTLVVSAAVAALAAAATTPAALDLSLWQDEVASARVILESTPVGVVEHVVRTESTPPGWYLLAWLGRQSGLSIEALRLLSVAFAASLSGLVVVYARRVVPLWAAAFSGILVALGWQLVSHGSELRAYALLALLTFVFALVLEAAAVAPTPGRLAALAACTGLGSFTHYFFFLTVLGGLAWLATVPEVRPAARRIVPALALGVAPLFAWLPWLADQYGAQRFEWIDSFDPLKLGYLYSALFWDPGGLYARSSSADVGLGEAAVRLAVLVLVLFGCAALYRMGPRGRLFALLAVVPVASAGLVWLGGVRIVDGRNMIGVGAFAAVAIAAAVAALPRRLAPAAVAAGVALAVVGYMKSGVEDRYSYDRVAASLTSEGWKAGDPILLFGSLPDFRSPLEWYLPGDVVLRTGVPARACEEIYVVTGPHTDREIFVHLEANASPVRAGTVIIARVPWSDELAAGAARNDGHLLASAEGGVSCVRPTEDRVI